MDKESSFYQEGLNRHGECQGLPFYR